MISLQQLLDSRDRRSQHQKDLLGMHPGKSLLCLTVQLPGAEKRNALSLKIAAAAVEAIRQAFPVEQEELADLETGYEGYFLLPLDPVEAKRRACHVEDTHPLGRLMDLDVLSLKMSPNMDAGHVMQFASANKPQNMDAEVWIVDRTALGLPPRRCLLCGNEVRYCMRAKTHSLEELLAKMEEMVAAYGRNR